MASKATLGRRQSLITGPFSGCYATSDPFDASPELLYTSLNGYVPDPASKQGWYARPQFRILNSGNALLTSAVQFRGQGVYCHTMLDGSSINFVVMGGHLFRVDSTLSVFTDVTPVGVTIDAGMSNRVYFASCVGTLTVNDEVHRPWVATNLTSTPITGTYIDYDGAGVAWTAYGAVRVYLGSVFAILNAVNGISRRADISWSAPGDPTTGWQQSTYDYNWTLSQNEAGLLYALESDNLALRYFRQTSIGAASGSDVTSLASTATDDAVAFNIGAQASATIQKFGTGFFFLDSQGRPYWFTPGLPPDPIWHQMRANVEAGTANNPDTTALVATAAIEPTFNLYIVAIWSPSPSTQAAPTEFHVFDAQTRKYQGRWAISAGVDIDYIGILKDNSGRPTLVVIGSKTAGPSTTGYLWAFSGLSSVQDHLTTQSGLRLTTQDGRELTTLGQTIVWRDDVATQDVYVQSDRLGYDESVWFTVDMATVITESQGPIEVTIQTSGQAETVQAFASPSASFDGTSRYVVGCNSMGRGPVVTVRPTSFDEQFICQRINLSAIPSLASWQDP